MKKPAYSRRNFVAMGSVLAASALTSKVSGQSASSTEREE